MKTPSTFDFDLINAKPFINGISFSSNFFVSELIVVSDTLIGAPRISVILACPSCNKSLRDIIFSKP